MNNPKTVICCSNCDFLRADNFCLMNGLYILTKDVKKNKNCNNFSSKIQINIT